MGRISDTAQRTFQIADELVASGVKPTVTAIRAITQEGSFSTISAALAQWKKARNWGVEHGEAASDSGSASAPTASSPALHENPSTGAALQPAPRVSMALEQRMSNLAGMLESYVQQSAKIALGMETTQRNLAQIMPSLERTAHSLEAITKEFREGFTKIADHVHYFHAISQMNIESSREQVQVYKERFENASLEYGMKENLLLSQVHALQQAIGGLKQALGQSTSAPLQEVASPLSPSEFAESENTPLWDDN